MDFNEYQREDEADERREALLYAQKHIIKAIRVTRANRDIFIFDPEAIHRAEVYLRAALFSLQEAEPDQRRAREPKGPLPSSGEDPAKKKASRKPPSNPEA